MVYLSRCCASRFLLYYAIKKIFVLDLKWRFCISSRLSQFELIMWLRKKIRKKIRKESEKKRKKEEDARKNKEKKAILGSLLLQRNKSL